MKPAQFSWLILFLLTCVNAYSQNDLLTDLKTQREPDLGYVSATFKSTRVINGHSVETLSKRSLDFRISHRFGKLNSGAYNLFGLDEATIRLGFEYGLTDFITLGVGRSSFEKTFDGYIKAKIFRQRSSENGSFPVSVTWFSNISDKTLRNGDRVLSEQKKFRYAYAHQIIIARKFSSSLSVQLAPILIHKNLAESGQTNDNFAIEAGGRFKITRRVSFNMDYIYRLPNYAYKPFDNSLSLGFDIETGGHVFQLHVTNSQGMIEELFVTRTYGRWNEGDLFYGFNVSRQFNFKKRK